MLGLNIIEQVDLNQLEELRGAAMLGLDNGNRGCCIGCVYRFGPLIAIDLERYFIPHELPFPVTSGSDAPLRLTPGLR